MGKYSPLRNFLSEQRVEYVPMTFKAIENIVGEPLPSSKKYPAWWSNNPSNNVMTKEWLAAGYQTESVDIAGEKLVFRRVRKPTRATTSNDQPNDPQIGAAAPRHPVLGCLKGTLSIPSGIDLTEPADPEWGKVYEED